MAKPLPGDSMPSTTRSRDSDSEAVLRMAVQMVNAFHRGQKGTYQELDSAHFGKLIINPPMSEGFLDADGGVRICLARGCCMSLRWKGGRVVTTSHGPNTLVVLPGTLVLLCAAAHVAKCAIILGPDIFSEWYEANPYTRTLAQIPAPS